MSKLLDKPLKIFTLYALIILAISIPVYVSVVEYIWTNELDEHNWLTLQHTKNRLQSRHFTQSEIASLNQILGTFQPGISIERASGKFSLPDSIYEVIRPNEYDDDDEEDRFRGLKSFVEINDIPYYLTIETNVEESDETFGAVALVTLFFFIVLILGFISLNRRIATKTWRPFYQTLEVLRSFELSKDKSIHFPTSDVMEFQELNESLLQLIKNNLDVYQQQKSFTENASHELQTPIALLKSKMDLLFQQKDLSPEISEIINAIEAPLSRLSRINKNLLLLAKVENHQYSDNDNLDVREYLVNAINLLEDYIVEKNLQISSQLNNSIQVQSNAFLLETMVHNLLSNAIRHTPDGGKIIASTHGKTLQVMNSGRESLDPNHIFERFSHSNKSQISSGLGLAIIREISNKYQWQASYHYENGFHVFTVNFS